MKIQPVTYYSSLSKQRFGSNNAMFKLFNVVGDFTDLGKSAVRHNQIIYASVIISRILFARTNNERLENARRDIPGWYFWFMGSPLMQAGIVRMLMPKAYRELLLTASQENASLSKKALWLFVDPKRLWRIASDKQIHQRKDQLIANVMSKTKAINGKLPQVAINEINSIKTMFTKTMHLRGLVSFIGFMFTILTLGVGINFINMALTKRNVGKEKQQQNQIPIQKNLSEPIQLSIPKPLSHEHPVHGHSPFVNTLNNPNNRGFSEVSYPQNVQNYQWGNNNYPYYVQ